jgi:hypothetical protein
MGAGARAGDITSMLVPRCGALVTAEGAAGWSSDPALEVGHAPLAKLVGVCG